MITEDLRLIVKATTLARSGTAKSLRRQAGLTVEAVAREIDVDASTVSRWEGGSRTPRGENAIKWAKLLDQLDEQIRQVCTAVDGSPKAA